MVVLLFILFNCAFGLRAGLGRVDVTPTGENGYPPLAGFNHGERRVKHWPLPKLLNKTSFMNPAQGARAPIYTRALLLEDDTGHQAMFITIDSIGSSLELLKMAYALAVDQGLKTPWESVILTASHSHSCPGANVAYFLWAMGPATDLLVPEVRDTLAAQIATAMLQAQNSLQAAMVDAVTLQMLGVTKNRRGGKGGLQSDSIDPNLGVMTVLSEQGAILGVVWNFAWHGVCYGPDNMLFSGDIMGRVNDLLEQQFPGAVALFQQADAGDIDPADGMCDNAPNFVGSNIVAQKIASQIEATIASRSATSSVTVTAASADFDMGPANLNYTLIRVNNCTSGGPLDICTLCRVLDCEVNTHFNGGWIANVAKYSAVKLQFPQKSVGFVTMPGEPLLELGWLVRNASQLLGFNVTFVLGYSNEHQGYFATPDQYVIGGYESILTLWGVDTALTIAHHAATVLKMVAP